MSTNLPYATDFTDIPLRSAEEFLEYHPRLKTQGVQVHVCPVCKGYGGWNIQLNAYGPGVHFQAGCRQCLGWGYVTDEDLCIHQFVELSRSEIEKRNAQGANLLNFGRCWHVYECRVCGQIRYEDTSD